MALHLNEPWSIMHIYKFLKDLESLWHSPPLCCFGLVAFSSNWQLLQLHVRSKNGQMKYWSVLASCAYMHGYHGFISYAIRPQQVTALDVFTTCSYLNSWSQWLRGSAAKEPILSQWTPHLAQQLHLPQSITACHFIFSGKTASCNRRCFHHACVSPRVLMNRSW